MGAATGSISAIRTSSEWRLRRRSTTRLKAWTGCGRWTAESRLAGAMRVECIEVQHGSNAYACHRQPQAENAINGGTPPHYRPSLRCLGPVLDPSNPTASLVSRSPHPSTPRNRTFARTPEDSEDRSFSGSPPHRLPILRCRI